MLLLLLPKIRAGLIYIRYAANAVGGKTFGHERNTRMPKVGAVFVNSIHEWCFLLEYSDQVE